MIRLPGTGIPIGSLNVAPNALVVCGESPADVFEIVSERLVGWTSTDLSWGFREFYFRNYQKSGQSLNVLVGGLGSASVELILQEATLAGVRNFVLSGTCASLKGLPVGSLIVPRLVCLRAGALAEYFNQPNKFACNGKLQTSLNEYLTKRAVIHTPAKCISTDAFYGIGGSYDSQGAPVYAGARLRNQALPQSLDVALQNSMDADALDMECAPFFALGGLLADVQVAAIKAVSNQIPWNLSDFDEIAIHQALIRSISAALDFVVEQASVGLRD